LFGFLRKTVLYFYDKIILIEFNSCTTFIGKIKQDGIIFLDIRERIYKNLKI